MRTETGQGVKLFSFLAYVLWTTPDNNKLISLWKRSSQSFAWRWKTTMTGSTNRLDRYAFILPTNTPAPLVKTWGLINSRTATLEICMPCRWKGTAGTSQTSCVGRLIDRCRSHQSEIASWPIEPFPVSGRERPTRRSKVSDWGSPSSVHGARCSSEVRAFAHGAMGRRIDPSWETMSTWYGMNNIVWFTLKLLSKDYIDLCFPMSCLRFWFFPILICIFCNNMHCPLEIGSCASSVQRIIYLNKNNKKQTNENTPEDIV